MSVAANCVLIRWLLRLGNILALCWPESICGKLVCRCAKALGRWVGGSAICRLIWRDGRLPAMWQETGLYQVLSVIADLPGRAVNWIYGKMHGLWEGSLVLRAVSALGGAAWCLVGFLLMAALMIDHSAWNNMYAFLGVVVILILFFVNQGSRAGHSLDVASIGPYLILYMAVACYCTAISLDVGLSLRFLVFHLTGFFLMLLVVSSMDSYRKLQILVALVVVGMTVGAFYGCYQAYIGVEVVPGQNDMSINEGIPGRVYSFFDNPNTFAGVLVMITPLIFALLLNSKSWRGKVASLFSLIVCVIALALTLSRAGWIGFVAAAVVFVAFLNWRFIPVLIVAGLCCLPLLPQSIYNRILTIGNSSDSSVNYRFAIYEASMQLLKGEGLLGVGLGSEVLHQAFQKYPPMYNGAYPVHTHNTYFQIWAETGLPGLLTFLAAMIHQLKTSVKAFAAAADKNVKRMLAGGVSALCGILVISLVEYVWFYPRNMFVFWLVFGIIAASVKLVRAPEGTK